MKEKSLGRELIQAVEEALLSKENGKIIRHKINISAIRKKLGMTQSEFSKEYHIKLESLRNWEQEKRTPDTTVLAYLTCIAKRPKLIREILNSDLK
jgi:putative transcriptional regulator